MATKLIDLTRLQQFGEGLKEQLATKESVESLQSKVGGIETKVNSLESSAIKKITINDGDTGVKTTGTTVDLTIPTKVSDLTDGSQYAKTTEVETKIQEKIAASKHTSMQVWTDSNPPTASDSGVKEDVIYLFKNTSGGYDMYALVTEGSEKKMVFLDDTTADLTGYLKETTAEATYVKKSELDGEIGDYLTENDYLDSDGVDSAIESALEDYTKTEELGNYLDEQGYAKKTYVDTQDQKYSTEFNQFKAKVTTTENFRSGAKNGTLLLGEAGSDSTGGHVVTVYDVTKDLAQDSDIESLLEDLFPED